MDMNDNSASPSTSDTLQQADAPELLYVDGLVTTPRAFSAEDLAAAKRITVTEDFVCDHKPTEFDQGWSGVSLPAILALAGPQPEAKFVRIHAGGYSVPVALDEIENALLADTLNGEPLSRDRGAPWRLYVPGAHCHVSVKWVQRLELTAARGVDMAERAERAREQGKLPSAE
jgi:DMSO/TMAO reductase YedYZ molybdopterin-dependent catalytic subunit